MPAHNYAMLPNSRRASAVMDNTAELDSAFESDDEEQVQERTPLTQSSPAPVINSNHANLPQATGLYDFERDYDYPPPGSPPHPSALALPNSFGNTNGLLPSPGAGRGHSFGRQERGPSFVKRLMGAVLPTHYVRVATADTTTPTPGIRGGGLENDGVFANVMAKPTPPRRVRGEDGEVHVMPEETQKDVPPSYAAAQADAVPPYWETTIHAPHLGLDDDMIIEGLPSGSFFTFAWNFLISMSFQFVGFMLTHILHTSHAAKYGSRAGLGVTLIQYGLFSRGANLETELGEESESETTGTTFGGAVSRMIRRGGQSLHARGLMPLTTTTPNNATAEDTTAIPIGSGYFNTSSRDWLSFLLMTAGWFLLLSSLLSYARIKRWERSIRASSQPQPVMTPESIARDRQVRERLNSVFGLEFDDYQEDDETAGEDHRRGQRNTSTEEQALTEEAGMRRNLRAVGLI